MSIYQHFLKDEHAFIDKILELSDRVNLTGHSKLLDFMSPREQEIIQSLVGEKRARFSGGTSDAERKRCLLVAMGLENDTLADFAIKILRMKYAAKFSSITHQQVLGTLMSLGVDRSKFGDIYLQEGFVDIIVCKDFADYIVNHVDRIGKSAVQMKEISMSELAPVTDQWNEKRVTVSSMRLDVILSEVLNLSRQKSQTVIEQGKVRVNWQSIENKSAELTQGDLISVRGFGRLKILSVEGQTKKAKWRVLVGESIRAT